MLRKQTLQRLVTGDVSLECFCEPSGSRRRGPKLHEPAGSLCSRHPYMFGQMSSPEGAEGKDKNRILMKNKSWEEKKQDRESVSSGAGGAI